MVVVITFVTLSLLGELSEIDAIFTGVLGHLNDVIRG